MNRARAGRTVAGPQIGQPRRRITQLARPAKPRIDQDRCGPLGRRLARVPADQLTGIAVEGLLHAAGQHQQQRQPDHDQPRRMTTDREHTTVTGHGDSIGNASDFAMRVSTETPATNCQRRSHLACRVRSWRYLPSGCRGRWQSARLWPERTSPDRRPRYPAGSVHANGFVEEARADCHLPLQFTVPCLRRVSPTENGKRKTKDQRPIT